MSDQTVSAPSAWLETGSGDAAPHWQDVLRYFHLSRDLGHTPAPEQLRNFSGTAESDLPGRWPLDALPFVLPNAEWQRLADGLVQRATLLNGIIADVYGAKTLLSQYGLPPALIYANPRYLAPLADYSTRDNVFLNLVGFDLGRFSDGSWRVLADCTEAPEGLGLCLENRILSHRALGPLFQSMQTIRLASFFSAMAANMVQQPVAPNSGISVILSPGPNAPGYYEHVYLGQYFGFPVVESADLTVRGTSLQLKTLEGLKTVRTVWRCTDSMDCDPLYLNSSSSDGVPGLVHVARDRVVHIANALGSGLVENNAFMSFMPGLCEFLLNEELKLPSVATWWCGQAAATADALDQPMALSFGPAFARPGFLDATNADYTALFAPPAKLDHSVVARAPIELSHAPYFDADDKLQHGPVTLRLFVAHTAKGYQLMPGGIARVTTDQGDRLKDVWVHGSALAPIEFPARVKAQSLYSDRDLPSRTADDLYWLGRYLERCEGSARAFRCLARRVAEPGADDGLLVSRTVIDLLVALETVTPSRARSVLAELRQASSAGGAPFALNLNHHVSDGLASSLQSIRGLASQIRERLSADAWRIFQTLPSQFHSPADLDGLLDGLSALNGLIMENMTRGYGWRLLELGRRLERAQFVLHALGKMVTEEPTPERLYLLLELTDTAITYRSRYQALPVLEHVLHLLMLDQANPRSVVYQIKRLRTVMEEMPLDQQKEGLSESQRILLSAFHELTLAEAGKLADIVSRAGNRTQLRRILKRLETTLSTLSELVTDTYFSHTTGSGQAR